MKPVVKVRVPATSANLGPAFDCAGLALTCHDVLDVAVTDGGLSVEVAGVGEGELPTDESHLVVRAFRAACDELGWSPAGLRLRARNEIPQGRGMGSSAAAVVAGVYAAWALCPDVGAVDGNAFSLEPTLQQSAYFRAPNRVRCVEGMYHVGGGTHPGAGIPGVLLGAGVTAGLVAADARIRRPVAVR